jgi:hypothetical protein
MLLAPHPSAQAPAVAGDHAAIAGLPWRRGLMRFLRLMQLLPLVPWLLAPACVLAQPLAEPRVDWHSADSAHFRVHYRATQRAQAEAVARAAERVYPRVTQGLQWQPRGRTEIVVYNEFDLANGFTTPLPFNLIGVFLAPPDEGELLGNSAWLDLLLVHEFTHAVHLDKVRGAPRVLQAIFGNVPWFIPNLFQPGWLLEGLAVWHESEPAAGRGRLQGPLFEAWLRAERQHGFIKLAELNADGRTLPLNKEYLYGAYFMEFMARRYGADKITAFVEQYSGNIVPRLHSGPYGATGKMMDELWDEFLADLTLQVDARAEPIRREPEALGAALAGPLFGVGSVAAMPAKAGGGWLAVVEDGLSGTHLLRLAADGSRQRVLRVNRGARVDVAPDGGVLVAQPDVCSKLYYAYDLYRLRDGSLQQLTACAHLRRAVQAGPRIVALQLDAGRTRLVQLGPEGDKLQILLDPQDGSDLTDLAASPDGRRVSLVSHHEADWQVLELDLDQPGATPRVLLRRNQPVQGLRHGSAGLEFILGEGGVQEVWRLQGDKLLRLTHSHTSVVAHAGSADDGSLVSVVIAEQGFVVHRLVQPVVLQSLAARTDGPAALADAAGSGPGLAEGRSYSALRSLYPRSWLPAVTADHGLTSYGASTTGADALGWHRYAALLMWETSQQELLGSLEYQFVGSHGLALTRTLSAQAWAASDKKDTTTAYDRHTKLQWLSQFPFTRLERSVVLGVGAAGNWTDRVDVLAGRSSRLRDERLVAGLLDVDLSAGDWASEGPNRGAQGTLLVESYKPLAHGDPLRYDGTVARLDLRGFLPIGRTVLALRLTEARAQGRTEPFQLGGATDDQLQFGTVLNSRNLSLRGYRGDESGLRGRNARVATVEWRTPLADIDRHAMVPAVGMNRLSATLFMDVGGASDTGAPSTWHRGVGVELLGEVKLLYAIGLQLRLGLARGLDDPKGSRAYLTAGRAF